MEIFSQECYQADTEVARVNKARMPCMNRFGLQLQQTLGDLLKSDEPPSPGTAAANERWLQMPHPEHFFKETDGFVVEDDNNLHAASSSSPMATVARTSDKAGSDARDTKAQEQDRMRSRAPTVLSRRDEKENRNCKVPVKEMSKNKEAVTAATRRTGDGGRDNKRRRAPGSVSVRIFIVSASCRAHELIALNFLR